MRQRVMEVYHLRIVHGDKNRLYQVVEHLYLNKGRCLDKGDSTMTDTIEVLQGTVDLHLHLGSEVRVPDMGREMTKGVVVSGMVLGQADITEMAEDLQVKVVRAMVHREEGEVIKVDTIKRHLMGMGLVAGDGVVRAVIKDKGGMGREGGDGCIVRRRSVKVDRAYRHNVTTSCILACPVGPCYFIVRFHVQPTTSGQLCLEEGRKTCHVWDTVADLVHVSTPSTRHVTFLHVHLESGSIPSQETRTHLHQDVM